MTNKEIRKDAIIKFKNNKLVIFSALILAGIVGTIITLISSKIKILSLPISILLPSCIQLSLTNLFYKIAKNGTGKIEDLIEPYKNNVLKKILTMLLMNLYLIGWSFLFWIPGIIKTFSYSQVLHILVDDQKDLYEKRTITASRILMNGNKLRLLKLGLPFIGYYIVAIIIAIIPTMFMLKIPNQASAVFITILSILAFFIQPIFMLSLSNFYIELNETELLKKVENAKEV